MAYVTASSMGDTEPSEDNVDMEDDEQQLRNYETLREDNEEWKRDYQMSAKEQEERRKKN